MAAREAEGAITIVHLSDLRFGWGHRFGSLAPPSIDDTFEALTAAICEDLGKVRDAGGGAVEPDLLVLSGDLTENARPSELQDVLRFVDSLAQALDLKPHRVVVIPGNRDVNPDACAAYFSDCRAEERQPEPPYWPKWRSWAAFFRELYKDHPDAAFEEGRPWTLFEVPDLKVTVAGLNSTLAESHEEHRGWLGAEQLRWFAGEMEQARHNGWLRIAVLHHDLRGAPTRREETLHDLADLKEILAPQVNLVLHGHAQDGGVRRLIPEVPAFATGTPEPGGDPTEARYQVLQIREDQIQRWSRVCEPGRSRWHEDSSGSGRLSMRLQHADETFHGGPEASAPAPGHAPLAPVAEKDDLLARVARVLQLEDPKARIERRRSSRSAQDYLVVTVEEGGMARSYPVGAFDRSVRPEDLAAFVAGIHRRYQEKDSGVISRLVYTGPPVLGTLALEARERKVRLLRLPELERQLIDLVPLVDRQNRRLEEDTLYPESYYVQQRVEFEDAGERKETSNALSLIQRWVTSSPDGRFILVLGDPGTGKTFLMRELARKIAGERDSEIVPILIDMRNLNKSRSLEELVAQHFAQEGVDFFPHRFRYLLENGRIALLFDGFDELATQMTYDRAADHLATLRQAAVKAAKVVVTSRRQHFISDHDLLTGMGEQVAQISGRRLMFLLPFNSGQIADFLQRRWGTEEAQRRLRLYEEVKVLGLAGNPRMLSFLSDLREEELRSAGEGDREIPKHEIYGMIVQRWINFETARANPRGSRPGLTSEQRWEAICDVAVRMWKAPDHTINLRELEEEVGQVLRALSDRERETAAFEVGSGTLLARDEHENFSFIDSSILEWIVARQASSDLQAGKEPEILAQGAATDDMLAFFIQMAGSALAVKWAHHMLDDPRPAVSENAQRLLNLVPEVAGSQRNLAGQDLRWQDFSEQDLTGADLSGSDLSGVQLLGAVLTSARLCGARLVKANLSRALLGEADLSQADLTGARLLRADLKGARLDGAVLRHANLIGASWDDGAFRSCDTYGAALELPLSIPAVIEASLPVAAMAWSARGDLLATASGNAVYLRETQSWRLVRRLDGSADRIRCLVFAPGDRFVAAGSQDGKLWIWDPATGEARFRLPAHSDAVTGLALKHDGSCAASASLDGTAAVWDTADGGELARFRGHRGPVRSIVFRADGGTVATGGEDRTVRFWDAAGARELQVLQIHAVPVCLGFSPRGTYFVAATDDRRLRIWKLGSRNEVWCSDPLDGVIQAMAFSPDERQLALALDSRTVRLWDPALKRESGCLTGHEAPVRTVAFHPDGRFLVSGSDNGTLRVWKDGREEGRVTGFRGGVRSLAFNREGTSLLSVLADGTIRNWDLGVGSAALLRRGADSRMYSELEQFLQRHGRGMVAAVSPDGARLATGSQDRTVRLWDLESGSLVRASDEHRDIRSLVFSPDGQLLATTAPEPDRRIGLIPVKGTSLPHTLVGHRQQVNHVVFFPDGKRLASSSADRSVRLWSIETGREMRGFPDFPSPVLALAVTPDGRRLAAACEDRSVHVLVLESGRPIPVFQGPRHPLVLAFSADGAVLAAAGEDGCVWIWQADRPVRVLEGHITAVRELAFSPDRRLLASGSDDNTIRLWDAQTWDCLAVLAPLREGWAAFRPDGRFRTSRTTGGGFWHAVGLCRFEPGELAAHAPRLALEGGEPLLDPASRRKPA